MNFVKYRGWFFLLSLLVIAPGIVFLIIAPGLRPGIDFNGGSTITIQFDDPVNQDELRLSLTNLGHPDATVQKLEENNFFIRTRELDEDSKDLLVESIGAKLSPSGSKELSFDLVSPVVAQETVINAFWAVLAASVGIFIYLWWAFRNVPNPFRYGTAAILALIHDAVVVIGIFAILGELADIEVNTMFLIALLTVIGYSVNDTIVVFDRLRENVLLYPNRTFVENTNSSIAETIGRSLNTSLTLLFTLLALLLFGGPTIRVFLWVLLIGVVAGTYSSIGIATQTLVVWENGDLGRIFNRLRGRRGNAAA
ncbi:MAG: protein translocase subunit SecF [SAR202 cluster bacterium]|nr:protein translocase subunit SecF [SAR202 cluster bacterium]